MTNRIPREIASLLESKHGYASTVREHGRRTAEFSESIARELGISTPDRDTLVIAAFLHDVGKLFVPTTILMKAGPLTPGEFAIVREHPHIGLACLRSFSTLADVARIVAQHHERPDGHGYPSRLDAREIHPLASIVSVADAFVAMTEERPYRQSVSAALAISELKAGAGRQFVASVVEAAERVYFTPTLTR